jgi:hypothetical protein
MVVFRHSFSLNSRQLPKIGKFLPDCFHYWKHGGGLIGVWEHFCAIQKHPHLGELIVTPIGSLDFQR